jgi:Uma2 family endonuclease
MSVTLTIATFPSVTIPDRATASLATFREWAHDNDLPEKTRTDYYKGKVWIDMGTEQVFSHGAVKSAIAATLYPLADTQDGDLFLINGVLVTNVEAELSGNPDMTLVRGTTFDAGRVTLVEASDGRGYVELEGTVDLVVEIVSPSSVKKDTQTLRTAYWEAGIPEYWLVDARGDDPEFRILKHGTKGYTEVKKQAGWLKSNVFGKSFRLTRDTDRRGNPTFTLEAR